MTTRVAVYSRVSTGSQDPAPQLHALMGLCQAKAWTVVGTYIDQGLSGALGPIARPQLAELLKAAARRQFDCVAVWSVDRLGRSLKDLVLILQDLEANHVNLYSHSQGIDTSTATGRMMWQFLSVFSEFERELIRERVKMGLARARANGRTLGRPARYKSVVGEIIRRRAEGQGILKISRALRVGTDSVTRVLRAPSSPS